MKVDLKDELQLDKIKLDEFFEICGHILPKNGCGYRFVKVKDKPEIEIKFGNENKNEFSVYVDKNSKTYIRAIRGRDLDTSKLQKLQNEIQNALTERGVKIYRSIIFSELPLNEVIKTNSFQLLPAPVDAPKHTAPMGQNSLIIEVQYESSDSSIINGYRARKKIIEYTLLSNLLLNRRVTQLKGESEAIMYWVATGTPESSFIEYCPERYIIPSFITDADLFTQIEADSIVSPDYSNLDEYYRAWVTLDLSLRPSSEFQNHVQKYEQLNENDKERFITALNWLFKVNYVERYSISLAILSLANTIEALTDEKIKKPKCQSCNEASWVKGDRALFREFLHTYAKEVDKTDIKNFYDEYRCRVAHGGILKSDASNGLNLYFDVSSWNEGSKLNGYKYVVKLALINWLISR